MTGIDLRDLLDERSAETSDRIMHHLRLVGVQRKVAARRRLRMAAAGTAAVAVLATGAAASVSLPDLPATQSGLTSGTGVIDGFPEYANGARVAVAGWNHLPARKIHLKLVPTTNKLVVFSRCNAAYSVVLTAEILINDRPLVSGHCNSYTRPDLRELADMGVRPGAPMSITMTILGTQLQAGDKEPVSATVPDQGDFGLAVGQRVPFDEYPLPPRPKTLAPLDPRMSFVEDKDTIVLKADPADPARPVARAVVWTNAGPIQAFSQTPGFLHVLVDGVEVGTHESWSYELSHTGGIGEPHDGRLTGAPLPPAGRLVTVRVVPEHVTGDWAVVLGSG
jgi:hypothetical protein